MKPSLTPKTLILLLIAATLAQPVFAQSLKEFFGSSETKALYLGIDFTQAKLIDDATANEMDIRDRQYNGINDLVVAESKKFDINGAFHKTNIDHDLGFVAKRNTKADAEKI